MKGLPSLRLLLDEETKRLKQLSGEMSEMRKAVLAEIESKITESAQTTWVCLMQNSEYLFQG